MGKAPRWFRSLFGAKKTTSSSDSSKEKKNRGFLRGSSYAESSSCGYGEAVDANKQAIAVAEDGCCGGGGCPAGEWRTVEFMSTSSSNSSWEGEKMATESGCEKIELLESSDDAHGGVMVDLKESMDSEVFASLIRASIALWIQQGKKGIWIKLPIELVNLVEAAVKQGFRYHHAESSYLMLVKWVAETEDSLPANASHRVGIGAFVMNNMGEVLVVQERSGRFKGTGVWKLPTGVVNEGEDISMGAIREVKEETGIESKFVEVLAFRQSHRSFFGKSDLFFVCMLRALSFDIQKQDLEIDAAKWMPFEEYAAQPFVQKHEMFKLIANVCLEKKKNNYTGFSAVPTTTSFSSKRSILYINKDL